jgi:hypothetical protein
MQAVFWLWETVIRGAMSQTKPAGARPTTVLSVALCRCFASSAWPRRQGFGFRHPMLMTVPHGEAVAFR